MFNRFIYSGRFWIVVSILIIVITIVILSKRVDKSVLVIDHVTVEKAADIKQIEDSLVVPILYSDVLILNQFNIEKRKNRFIDVMLPTILIYRHQLELKKEKVAILQDKLRYSVKWSNEDSLFMDNAFEIYYTKNINELLKRMEPPPISLVLAQASLESGWGSSRFFKEANNVFGIWSYDPKEDRIIANQFRDGNPIYLKKYKNLLGSVEDYHILLAKSNAYSGLRDCINGDNNVFEMIWFLRMYSERRDQYVIMLRNVIVTNELIKYDNFILDPEFFDYPKDQNSMF